MVQTPDNFAHDLLELREIAQQADGIKLRPFEAHAHSIVVPMRILTLTPVSPQRVTRRKRFFHTDLKHSLMVRQVSACLYSSP